MVISFARKKYPQVNAVSGLLEVTRPSTGDSALMLVRIDADRGRQCRVTALAGADCGLIFWWTLIHCNLKIGGRHYDGTEMRTWRSVDSGVHRLLGVSETPLAAFDIQIFLFLFTLCFHSSSVGEFFSGSLPHDYFSCLCCNDVTVA